MSRPPSYLSANLGADAPTVALPSQAAPRPRQIPYTPARTGRLPPRPSCLVESTLCSPASLIADEPQTIGESGSHYGVLTFFGASVLTLMMLMGVWGAQIRSASMNLLVCRRN
jgi:hypothetical protein